MRILRLESVVLSIPGAQIPILSVQPRTPSISCLRVCIHSDGGVTGDGFAFTPGPGVEVMRAVVQHDLSEALIGQDPLAIGAVSARLWNATQYHGRKGAVMYGLAAIEMALWDLLGKACGMPLHRLLGAQHAALPAYVNPHFHLTDEELLRFATQAVEDGFCGFKLNIGHDLHTDVRRVQMVREALGADRWLMLDALEAYRDSVEAERALRAFEEFDIFWFEEPLPAHLYEEYAALQQRARIPLAGGEHAYGLPEIAQYLNSRAVRVLQPDVFRMGGIRPMMKAGALAEAAGIPVAPHTHLAVSLPVAVSLPNALVLEYMPLRDGLFLEIPTRADGRFVPSEEPGLGLRWKPEVLERFRIGE
jgi:L-alanine-DL-glutamate epimerase-like enolase superfamily enzyme